MYPAKISIFIIEDVQEYCSKLNLLQFSHSMNMFRWLYSSYNVMKMKSRKWNRIFASISRMLLQDRRYQEMTQKQNGKRYTWTAKSAKKRETMGKRIQWIGKRETDQLRIDQVMPRSPCVWVALLRVVMWWLDGWPVAVFGIVCSSLITDFGLVCSSVIAGWRRGRPGPLFSVMSLGSDGSWGTGGDGLLMYFLMMES